MPSVYGGIAEGIQQGYGLANAMKDRDRQAKLDQERQEDRTLQRGLQARQLADSEQARAEAEEGRKRTERQQDATFQIKDIDDQLHGVQTQLLDYSRRGVPEDDPGAAQAREQAASLLQKKRETYKTLYGPQLKQDLSTTQQVIQQLSNPKSDPTKIPDDKLYTAYSTAYGDHVDKMLTPQFGQALQTLHGGLDQFHEALSKGDNEGAQKVLQEQVLPGLNVIGAPEIGLGVGGLTPDGTARITGQQIETIAPSPRDPSKLVIGLRNQVQRADGAQGEYHAPLTQNRAAGDDQVKEFDPKELYDYVGRVSALYDHLQDPAVRSKIENAAKSGAAQRFATTREAYLALGGDIGELDPKRKLVDAGDRLISIDERTGKPIAGAQDIRKGAAPREYDPAGEALKLAQADFYRGNRGQSLVLIDKAGNQTPYTQGQPIPEGSTVQQVAGPGAARGGLAGAGGSVGGKRGEYLDLVAKALQAVDPKLKGETDINKLRYAALEYGKRDPVKLAATLASQMRKEQADPLFQGQKQSDAQIAQAARSVVDSLNAVAPAAPPAAAAPPAGGLQGTPTTAAPAAPPAASGGLPGISGADYSNLWQRKP